MHLKKTINPNSVPVYMTGIKHFFVVNRIRLFWEIIHKMYPQKVKRGGQMSTSRVSGLILVPTSIINEPKITVAASRNGIRFPLFDSKLTAIRGAHEPKSKPPL